MHPRKPFNSTIQTAQDREQGVRLRYEFLTSIHNAGITLNSNLQNLFVPIFDLHGIAESYFPTIRNPHPPQDLYNARMARSTYFTNLYCKYRRVVLLFAQ